MKNSRWKKAGAVTAASLGVMMVIPTQSALASSHREAPGLTDDPTVDNTDVYVFRDVADANMVNIVANFIPFEEPQAGPNFYKFGDDVKYSIHIDNNHDVQDDITFNFRFRTTYANGATFLYNTGPVTSPTDPDQNLRQTYSVEKVQNGASTMLVTNAVVPPVHVGVRTANAAATATAAATLAANADANYETQVASPAIANLAGGGRVWTGQRDDPFFVDTGSIFDLLGLRPLNSAHALAMDNAAGVDGLARKNVHTIALQLPISSVTSNGAVPTTVDAKESVIGVYSSASRQRVKVLSLAGGAPRNSGRFVQVSRLAIPLVNEVLIPIGKKDLWNASRPADDAQFFGDILDPEPTKLMDALYPGTYPQGGFNADGSIRRTDIVAVLTGQGAGLSAANALPPADLLRINLAVAGTAPNATPVRTGSTANTLGVIGGDNGGFPNGRRLMDDVTDIELRLLAGGTVLNPTFNVSPNNALTDGVDVNDRAFMSTFPYVGIPFNGYSTGAPAYPVS